MNRLSENKMAMNYLKYSLVCVTLMMPLCNVNAQFTNGNFNTGATGCNAGTGWTTISGPSSAEHAQVLSPAGNYWIDLTPCGAWGNNTWIEQAVPTVIGNCYYITFDLGTYCNWDKSDAGTFISINGTALGPRIVNDSMDCTQPLKLYWKNMSSLIFTATTNPTIIRFTGAGRCTKVSPTTGGYACTPIGGTGNPGVIALDNVVLVPVSNQSINFSLGNDTLFCGNFSHELNSGLAPGGGITRLWNTGDTAQSITITTPGTYWCKATSPCGTSSDTIVITQAPLPVVNLGVDITECSDVNITLAPVTASSGTTYLWSTGATTTSIPAMQSGSYWLELSANGCKTRDTVEVTRIPMPNIDFGPDKVVCNTDLPIMLSSPQAPGSQYKWSNGLTSDSIEVVQAGTYWLEVNTSSCIGSDTVKVTVVQAPVVDAGRDSTICEVTPVIIGTFIPEATYKWSNDSTYAFIHVNKTGDYTLTVTLGPCVVNDMVTITAMPNPAIDLGIDTDICPKQIIVLNAGNPGSTYKWGTGETTPTYSADRAGKYWVTVTSQYYCVNSDTISFKYYAAPTVILGDDTTVCEETPLLLRPIYSINDDSLIWSNGTIANEIAITKGGPYMVTAINKCGNDTDVINVRQIFCDIWLPNAFTPNGDGVNDILRVVGNIGRINDFSLSIYNRWGELVFTTTNKNAGWDGMYKGVPATIDTYVYMYQYSLEGTPAFEKGNVMLIR